jgi:hypothetical protein
MLGASSGGALGSGCAGFLGQIAAGTRCYNAAALHRREQANAQLYPVCQSDQIHVCYPLVSRILRITSRSPPSPPPFGRTPTRKSRGMKAIANNSRISRAEGGPTAKNPGLSLSRRYLFSPA